MGFMNIRLEDKIIERERLELRDKDTLYFLGPNLTLRSCVLRLQVPASRLNLFGLRLIDCSLEVKRELKNLNWYKVDLRGCRFTGRLSGCDFGHWPDPVLLHREVGNIEHCDFTAAHLHGCRFVRCDPSTLRFPPWPCFTILEPRRRWREFAAIPWPGELGRWFTIAENDPEGTVAATLSATELAKQANVAEERIRDLLQEHSDVLY